MELERMVLVHGRLRIQYLRWMLQAQAPTPKGSGTTTMTEPTYWLDTEEGKAKVNVRKLRKERADKGWSEYDFWNFHSYHSWMMITVLERFKTGVGHPGGMTLEEWLGILDEMIDGFKAALDMTDMCTYDPKIHKSYKEWEDPLRAKYERGMDLFREYYLTLWD
jgi:hypothetical protein